MAFYFVREGEDMRIEERVSESIKRKLGYNNDSNRKRKKKHHERITKQDIEELMGVNRPTYKRGRGGALRQR